jgi:hypothetical protein
MRAIFLGAATLLYWLCFGIVIVGDLYLSYPEMGMVVKILFPLAVLCNVAGTVSAIIHLVRRRSTLIAGIAGIALNVLPLVSVLCFFLWLYFWFKM